MKTQDSAVLFASTQKSASSNMNALLLVAIVCSLQFKGGHTQGALFSFVLDI